MKSYTLPNFNIEKIILPILITIFSFGYLNACDSDLPDYTPPTFSISSIQFYVGSISLTSVGQTTSLITPDNSDYNNNVGVVGPNVYVGIDGNLEALIGNAPYFSQNIAGWIDFDQNGQLDANELLFVESFAPGQYKSINIPIPATASKGESLLRIISYSGSTLTPSPTGTFSAGQANDYPIVLVESSPYCYADYLYNAPLDNYISGVEFGCIQNMGSGNMYGPTYSDFTEMSTILEVGETTMMTIYSASAENCVNVINTWVEAWIDYDGNGVYSSNESILQYNFAPNEPSVTLPITIPNNGFYGEKRLRIRSSLANLPGPCGYNSCGEVEEYTVFIAEEGIVSPESGCTNESLVFETEFDIPGATYQWAEEGNPVIVQQNPTEGWIEYEWSEAGSYNVTLEITHANGCVETYSNSVNIEGVVVSIADAGLGTVCGGEILELSATSLESGDYVWSGEGITGNGQVVTINTVDLTLGAHTYCVTLTNAEGCVGTACVDIEIHNPIVEITAPSTVCLGGNIELFAESIENGTYAWLGEGITSNGQSAIVNTLDLAVGIYTYTVTFFSDNGCMNTASTTIEIFSNPIAEICVPTTTILTCMDTSIILDATCSTPNGSEYAWSGPSGDLGTSSNVTITEAGTYTVIITDSQTGCTNSDNIEITEAPAPEVEIFHNGCLCEGDSSSLLLAYAVGSGGNNTYSWTGEGITSSNSNDNPISLPVLSIGIHTYTVTYTDEYGCTATDSKDIVVTEAPDAGVGGSSLDVCSNGNAIINLLGEIGGTPDAGVWEDTDNSRVDLSDPMNVDFSGIAAGNYTFTFTVAGAHPCADASSEVEINVFSVDAGADGNTEVCNAGDTEVNLFEELGGTPDGGGTWEDNDNSGVNLSDQANVDFVGVPVGTYVFTYTVQGTSPCSDASSEVVVDVLSTTVEIITGVSDNSICEGETLELSVSSPTGETGNYEWEGYGITSDNSGDNPLVLADLPVGTYTYNLTYTNENECTATDSTTITVEEAPDAGTSNSIEICGGETTIINFMNELGGTPDSGGTWTDTDNAGVDLTDITNVDFTNVPDGSYTFTYTVSGGTSCADANSELIIAITTATAEITTTSNTVCEGENVELSIANSGGSDNDYTWTGYGITSVNSEDNPLVLENLPVGVYTYNLIHTNENGCIATDSTTITVEEAPDAGTSNSIEICGGETTVINFMNELGGTPDSGGTWTDTDNAGVDLTDITNVDLTNVSNGSYTFTYTVSGGTSCTDASSELVIAITTATAEITTTSNTVCEGGSIELSVVNSGGSNNGYVWSGYDITPTNSGDNPLVLVDLPVGTYTYNLIHTNENGCVATDSTIVTIVEAPDAGSNNSTDICKDETTIVNFSDLLGGTADSGGTWVDMDNSGVDLTDVTNVDFTNIPDGSYTFTYTVPGMSPCVDASSELVVNIFSGADAGGDGSTEVCNNGDVVDLFSLLEGTPDTDGIWEDMNNSGVDLSDPTNVDFSGVPAGSYTFTYIVTGENSCGTDSSEVTINVGEIVTDFCFEVDGNTVIFTNNSTGSAVLSYLWNFGDGTTSTEQNPIKTYTASTETETYEICLTVTFENGTTCCITCCKSITIFPPCRDNIPGPKFNYLFKNDGYVKFNNPSGVGNAYTKEWTIDGVFYSDINQAPPTILSPGVHMVCLEVTKNSNPNCSEKFCRNILVDDPCVVPSTVEFSYRTCLDSKTFIFESITTGVNTEAVSHWDFGNGITTTGNITQFSYSDYGSYMVCLNVENSENCSKQTCGIIEVIEPSCTDDCPSSSLVTDGEVEATTPEVGVIDELNKGTALQFIPNPASNLVKAVFTEIQSDKAMITLSNLNGKMLRQTSIQKGTRNYEFDISDLPAGVYIMTLEQSNGEKISSKIMKM